MAQTITCSRGGEIGGENPQVRTLLAQSDPLFQAGTDVGVFDQNIQASVEELD